jgi:integrase/recombinase XerD
MDPHPRIHGFFSPYPLEIGVEVIEQYLEWQAHNRGRSELTVEKYRRYLLDLQEQLQQAGKHLANATIQDLEAFTGVEAHKRGISPRSRRPMVSAVRGFFSWAHSKRLVRSNPAANLPYPRAGQPLPTPLSLKHAEALIMQPDLTTFRGVRDAAILSVLIGCGLRVSGVCALNESHLQWVDYQGKEWLVLKVREKGRKERLVPAPHETRLLIRAYLGHEELEQIDRTLPDGDKVLFASTMNRFVPAHEYFGEARRLRPRAVNKIIELHGTAAGIPRGQLHAHAARHLYGTELAEQGHDLRKIQALMGHEDIRTTTIYTRLAMRTLAKAVETGNPLGRIRTPVTELLHHLDRA